MSLLQLLWLQRLLGTQILFLSPFVFFVFFYFTSLISGFQFSYYTSLALFLQGCRASYVFLLSTMVCCGALTSFSFACSLHPDRGKK